LLDNILDGALMYDIKADEEDAHSSSKNLSNVEDDSASGLSIKYANRTLRNLFKSIMD